LSVLAYLKRALSPNGHDCAGDASVFVSKDILGDGNPQLTPHGLGAVPAEVEAYLVGGPAGYAQPVIVMGGHDATNCCVTCTIGWTYRVRASV
jgi:hypothetical protein